MKKEGSIKKNYLVGVFIRYFLMAVLAIPNFWIFYLIFTPLTIYPVYFLLKLIFNASLSGEVISVNTQIWIRIIDACVAGSAYYLFLILNLSTPNINLKKRIAILSISFLSFLIINIIRIFIFSILFIYGASWFDFTHKLFWYLGSILFVILIWFAQVKYFNIKNIPFFSDLKFFFNLLKKR